VSGPVGYATGNPQHLGAEAAEDSTRRPYSEYTQRIVEEEAARLVRHAEGRATALLRDHRCRASAASGNVCPVDDGA
jgi:cell division protease FtsH